MGIPVCTIGKIGMGFCSVCKAWASGRITSGSVTVHIAGTGVARDGDTVQATCGHCGTLHASTSKKVNGIPIARISDTFSGDFTGVMIEGVDTVTAG